MVEKLRGETRGPETDTDERRKSRGSKTSSLKGTTVIETSWSRKEEEKGYCLRVTTLSITSRTKGPP